MANVYRTEQFRVAIAKEATYGYKTGTTNWANSDFASASLGKAIGLLKGYEPPDPEAEWKVFRKIGVANSRHVEEFIAGKLELQGNVPFLVQNGRMIAYAMGTDTYAGGTHIITPNVTLPSFGMMVARLDSSPTTRIFSGNKINQLSLAADDEGMLLGTMNTIAQNVATNTSAIPTCVGESDDPYWFHKSAVTFWGSTIGRLQDFELTINNNLKPKRYFKTAPENTLSELLEGAQDFTIKASIAVDSMDVYTRLKNRTPFDLSILFTRGSGDTLEINTDISAAGTRGAGANNCVIQKAPYQIPESDEVVVPVQIQAKRLYFSIADDEGSAYI